MRKLIIVLALLVAGQVQGQVVGTGKYTTKIDSLSHAESGVRSVTLEGAMILIYPRFTYNETQVAELFNECAVILDLNGLDINEPEFDESSLFMDSRNCGEGYNYTFLMAGETIDKAWSFEVKGKGLYTVALIMSKWNAHLLIEGPYVINEAGDYALVSN